MLRLLTTLLLVSGFTTALSAQFNYAPNAISIPNLRDRFDGTLALGLGRGEWLRSREIQLHFSPVRHLALVANAMLTGSKDIIDRDVEGSRYAFWEAGAGYYQAYAKGTVSLLAGMGQGNLNSTYNPNRKSHFETRRWFVQPGIAYQDQYFSGGVAIRLNRLEYPFGETDYALDEFDLKAIRAIEQNAPFFLPELGIRGGLHFRPVTINIHLTLVFPSLGDLNYTMSNFTMMFGMNMGELKKEKTSKKQSRKK